MYSIYSVVLVCYIIFSSKILIFEKEQFQRTFNNLPLIIWSMIIFIVFGLLLGLEKFLLERRKDGRWKINLPKLVLLGIPSLYFSLGIILLSIPINFIPRILFYPILYFLKYEDILSIFQVVLGYIISMSFIKKK